MVLVNLTENKVMKVESINDVLPRITLGCYYALQIEKGNWVEFNSATKLSELWSIIKHLCKVPLEPTYQVRYAYLGKDGKIKRGKCGSSYSELLSIIATVPSNRVCFFLPNRYRRRWWRYEVGKEDDLDDIAHVLGNIRIVVWALT